MFARWCFFIVEPLDTRTPTYSLMTLTPYGKFDRIVDAAAGNSSPPLSSLTHRRLSVLPC